MHEYIQNSKELSTHLLMPFPPNYAAKQIKSANVIKASDNRCSFIVLENVQGIQILTNSTSITQIKFTFNTSFIPIKYTRFPSIFNLRNFSHHLYLNITYVNKEFNGSFVSTVL